MPLSKADFAVLDRFGLEVAPVGIKFLPRRPGNVPALEENITFCQMLKKAQEGHAFYAGDENHTCDAGPYVLGRTEVPPPVIAGEYGAGLKIFEEPRSGSRLYQHLPWIIKGAISYVAFSPISQLPFNPDLLVILARTDQTEILLRAMSYRTGEVWHSRTTPAVGCAWIFIYPYISGKVNYITTGMGHGMKRRKLFPEGRQIISIPYDLLPSILQTLKEMPWSLPAMAPDGMEFVKRLNQQLGME